MKGPEEGAANIEFENTGEAVSANEQYFDIDYKGYNKVEIQALAKEAKSIMEKENTDKGTAILRVITARDSAGTNAGVLSGYIENELANPNL